MNKGYLALAESELNKRIGCMAQVCYAKKMEFADGPARGLQFVEVQNGSGLLCHVLSDRGMGIGHVTVKGIPTCWISPNEEIAPAYYDPNGEAWLESFGGGMVTSCGLTNVGSPTKVEGIDVGLHGRLSHLPARNLTVRSEMQGKEYAIIVEGDMVDCRVMGPTFMLHRSYTFYRGKNEIHLHDHITNMSDTDQPLFVLYHLNVGYPFLSENTKLSIDDREGVIDVKNDSYKNETNTWDEFTGPVKGITERVFYHHLKKQNKASRIVLQNEYEDYSLRFEVSFPLNEINHLVEWKMLGEKNYILGLEPGNTFASGRDYSFSHNDVEFLKAGAEKDVHLNLFYCVSPR